MAMLNNQMVTGNYEKKPCLMTLEGTQEPNKNCWGLLGDVAIVPARI